MIPLLLLATLTQSAPETDLRPGLWSQWRGPERSGIDTGRAWPRELSKDNLTQQWRIELGPSYSGPVVDAARIYTTATVDEKNEVVRAVDRETGETAWEASWSGAMKVPFFAARNGSWIRSTPAVADGRLFVFGMLDVLVALDAETGKELWKVDFKERYGTKAPDFGAVPSPLVDGDHVYIQAANSIVKLDSETGETVWRALAPSGKSSMMSSGAFSSPAVATLGGERQLLVQTREQLAGVAIDDGAVLWRHDVPHFRGMNILTPQPYGTDGVFTSTYNGKSHFFRVGKSGEEWTCDEAWTTRDAGYMSSPVVLGDRLYMYLQRKRLACIDLAKGESAWLSDAIGDEYWSMVAQGDRMLALSEGGELLMLADDAEGLKELGRVRVAESESWAHLAVDGDQVLVRDLDGMTAYRWGAPSAETSSAEGGTD